METGTDFSLLDVPFFLVLGLLAGLLGALFCRGIFAGLAFNRFVLKVSLPWRVSLAGLVSGLIVMLLPPAFRDSTGLQEFVSTGEAGWAITVLVFVIKFGLTLIAYGSGAPGGIFAPSLVLGSALGFLVGSAAHGLMAWMMVAAGVSVELGSTATYALAGMGAFFSAVTRGPITAIVIVFEITTDFNLVLPLMISSVVAYLIADKIASGSFYNQLLMWNGIHLEKEAVVQGPWAELTAASLMQRRVETLSSRLTLREATEAFSRSHHRGFPVMEDGRLVGIVTQTDLADVSRRPAQEAETTLADIMTPQPVTVQPTDPLTHVLYLLNRFKLSRLPVTEGHKLVGIITRADIIRAESDRISGETQSFGPQPQPSYLVYQTRSPASGKGRILVPLSNPQTMPALLKLAVAIAQTHQYEVECLQVITLSRSQPPDTTPVRTTTSRRLLQQAERFAHRLRQDWPVPIHTQIRVAHDSAQAMLETIAERHIDLILMGWKGATATPGRIFGGVVDTIIRQAACDVVLVKLSEGEISERDTFDHWLVPIAGGPNSQHALRLLPALLSVSDRPDVRICQVFTPEAGSSDSTILHQAIERLSQQVGCPVVARPVWGNSVPEAVTQLAWTEQCDVIMVGASREGLLQQVIRGNIPEAIARTSNRTVILVRGIISPAE